jgi:hypothetical protein
MSYQDADYNSDKEEQEKQELDLPWRGAARRDSYGSP